MIPFSQIVAETQAKMYEPMTVEEERKFWEELQVLIADEMLERAEKECPGWDAFTNMVLMKVERLNRKQEVRA